jgi:leucyl/phenylalanyl-tRNA--protein transferase
MAHPDRLGLGGESEIEWVQPRRRAIIPLDDQFHVPKSLAQRVRSGRFTITTDTAFESVIRACAAVPRQDESGDDAGPTWLAPEIVEAFLLLHKHGHAHSIEAWLPSSQATPPTDEASRSATAPPPSTPPHLETSTPSRVLVGGLYGLALGKVFCGESMFHSAAEGGTDASKVCLVQLVQHLRARGFELLDAQLANPHTAQFGMYEMPREQYLAKLGALSMTPVSWTPFVPSPA